MTDVTVRYAPGAWVALSTGSLWALVDLSLEEGLVSDLWAAADGGMEEVLEVLLRGGLRALPAFAVVQRADGALHYAVRAPATITAASGDVTTTLDASAVGGWSSGILPHECTRVVLAGPGTPGKAVLPTGVGVAAAGVLTLDLGVVPSTPGDPSAPDAITTPPAREETGDSSQPERAGEPVPARAAESTDDEEASDDAVTEQRSGEEDLLAPLEPAGPDRVSTYYELLVSATGDRNKLLERLREQEQEQDDAPSPAGVVPASEADPLPEPSETPAALAVTPDPTVLEPASPRARDTTVIWKDEPETLPGGALIDGLPWVAPGLSVGAGAAHPRIVTPAPTDGEVRSVDRDEADADEPARTLSRAALLRDLGRAEESGPTLLAVRCPVQHLSPPYAVVCRVCGAPLPEQSPLRVKQPVLGRLVLSDGSVVALDKGVVFGRAPHSDAVDPAGRPNLVRLADGLISRQHASVAIDGWDVLVRDLGSENGTLVMPPGGEPELIAPLHDHVITPGTVVTFADAVSFTYEVSP